MKASDIEYGIKSVGCDIRNFYVKNKAHIFTGLGITGTILTGVTAAQSGAKSARKIDQMEEKLGRHLTGGEKFKLCWKDYILPSSVGVLACFSEFKSDQINTRTIADRTTLLIASEKAYEKLSQKTKEVLGEKKAKQIKDEIVKEDVKQSGVISQENLNVAPKTGNGQLYPFVDSYTKLLFWSNIDYINCCVMKLQNMMRELTPRDRNTDYVDKKIGIPYSEWLAFIGFDKSVYNTPERRNIGWNKGFAFDGSDDDEIDYATTTMEWSPGFAVTCIDWVKDPTDMKNGRLLKSSGL